MLRTRNKLRICALLLGLVFLAAQFHFCADLTSASGSSSHFCPFCATTGSAIAASAPAIGLAPANTPVERPATRVVVSTDAWFSIAPRAPPAL